MSNSGATVTKAEDLEQPVTIGAEAYISPDYVRLERDHLWRKVWLQAGRVEEIPEVGSHLSYEILDDSVVIVRTATNQIKAFHNVCTHRGRLFRTYYSACCGGHTLAGVDVFNEEVPTLQPVPCGQCDAAIKA